MIIDKDFMTETKIVGVTQFNDKGFPIQMLLRDLSAGDRLIFIRDYGNQYDENAIKIYSLEGDHIGYVSKELAKEIAPFLDKNLDYDLEGLVLQVTGGEDGKSFGCNIRIWIETPAEPSYEEIKNFQERYTNQNKKKHKETDIYFSIGLTAIIIFVILGVCSIPFIFKNSSDSTNENKEEYVIEELITLNEYNRLSVGMSRSEVYEIVGSFGELISESSTEGYYVKTYSYEGYGSIGANAQLMFTNGMLDTMAQFGLEYYHSIENESITNSSFIEGDVQKPQQTDESYVEKNPTNPVFTPTPNSSVAESEIPKKEEPIVKISELEINYTILPPNSIGTVWMEGTYTNNSKYTIVSFSVTVLLKDKNDKVFLSCYDTVLPGETSPVFDTFGPNTQSSDDVEFLKCSLRVIDETGDSKFIDYDYKLKSYDLLG